MMTYNLGDILLIKFPFTDSSRLSKRPALVLYDNGDLDILLCRITTHALISHLLTWPSIPGKKPAC